MIFKSEGWGGDVTMALAKDASVKVYGDITGSGIISASSTLYGDNLIVRNDVTASGEISSSTTLYVIILY